MFNFFKKSRKSGDGMSERDIYAKLDGRAIKYVTERLPGSDTSDSVVGKEGALIIREDELIVYASVNVVFRAKIPELTASELMSLEGVILTAPDMTADGRVRTIIAYYTYYLKS
jgi:hypothetical protein